MSIDSQVMTPSPKEDVRYLEQKYSSESKLQDPGFIHTFVNNEMN